MIRLDRDPRSELLDALTNFRQVKESLKRYAKIRRDAIELLPSNDCLRCKKGGA